MDTDRDLRARFAALRRADRATTPDFTAVVGRSRAIRRCASSTRSRRRSKPSSPSYARGDCRLRFIGVPKQTITVDLDLTADESKQLNAILQRGSKPLALDDVCTAAAEEYVRMILGQRVFGRFSDIQEYRLLLLIRCALGGVLPSERLVASLFQITDTRARSLIAAVLAKYQYELEKPLKQSLKDVLNKAQKKKDADEFVIQLDDSMLKLLQARLRALGKTYPAIRKTDNVGEYAIAPSARTDLLKDL